jgi:hypothetical protein
MEISKKDMEIIEKGTLALIKELGYSGFLKYLSRVNLCKNDYIKEQEDFYREIVIVKEEK